MGIPYFLVQDDLEARKISSSRKQTEYLQREHGFPLGRMLSPKIRGWTEAEIASWLATRPTAGMNNIPEEKRNRVGRPRKQQLLAGTGSS
jgi:predicted DNA-binding transcriptional regulator AlpA